MTTFATYPSISDLETANVAGTVQEVEVLHGLSWGDGGGFRAIRVGSAAQYQSADGAHWKIASAVLTPAMFKAVGDNSTDDTTALQNAITASGALRRPLRDRSDGTAVVYKTTGTLTLPDHADVVFEKAQVHYTGTGRAVNVTGSNWRFQMRGGLYGDANRTITGITQANPAVVTCPNHGFTTGARIRITGIEGMTEVNLMNFEITVINANSFSLNGIDSTGYGAYAGGGAARAFRTGNNGISGALTSVLNFKTNLLTNSEIVTAGTNTTVTANAATSPPGTFAADKIAETSANGVHQADQRFYNFAAGQQYTYSQHFKAVERSVLTLVAFDAGSGLYRSAHFDLGAQTATAGTTGLAGSEAISDAGSGWYRCAITFTPTAGGAGSYTIVSLSDGSPSGIGDTYAGATGSGLYAWGAQLITGSAPGGYLATTSSPNIADNITTWIENFDISGSHIWGFGENGVDLRWIRDFRFDDMHTHDCGWSGMLLQSAVRGTSKGRIKTHDIGPGFSGVTGGYGLAFSRSADEDLDYNQAPRSQLLNMDEVFAYNIPYYGIGFDTHGGYRISLNHLKTSYCHIACNIEASPDMHNAASDNITIGTFDCIGCNPARHDIGPAFAIDAVYWRTGGGDEIARGISIGSGSIKWHGHKNTFGNAVFGDGAAIYATHVRGFTVGDVQFVDCYKRAVRTVADCDGVSFSNLTCVDLVADGGTQDMFQFGAETIGTVDNVTMIGSGGRVFDVSAATASGYGVKVGRNISYSSGISKFSSTASANLIYDPELAQGTWSPTATLDTNADAASFSGCQYIRVGSRVTCWGFYTIKPTATGDVQVGCPLPIASGFTLQSDAAGNFNFGVSGYANSSGGIFADNNFDRVIFRHNAASTTSNVAYFTFGYQIK